MDRLNRFSRDPRATNWIEVKKKMAYNLNYFSEDEEPEWLVNNDPISLLDKSNEEKQLDDSEIPSPFRVAYFCYAFLCHAFTRLCFYGFVNK